MAGEAWPEWRRLRARTAPCAPPCQTSGFAWKKPHWTRVSKLQTQCNTPLRGQLFHTAAAARDFFGFFCFFAQKTRLRAIAKGSPSSADWRAAAFWGTCLPPGKRMRDAPLAVQKNSKSKKSMKFLD